ncbi:metal ABC transporter substrate-binding protein [Lachnospiraceae bacterium 62-35]
MKREDSRLSVVTTIFPYYDFIRQVGGDRIRLSMVVPAGMDSHSFEPTPGDMKLIQEGDILICNGGSMEHWVREVQQAIDTSNMEILTMMDYVDLFEEEHVEGMEESHEKGDHESHTVAEENYALGKNGTYHGSLYREEPYDSPMEFHTIYDEDRQEHAMEYDEHIWTSPANAIKIVAKIEETLKKADPAGAEEYEARSKEYQRKLRKLDKEFQEVMKIRKRNMVVLGDKFPFRYLVEAYDLDYRAAFSGCSTDTEPSARTIAYLIEKVREEQIPAVYYLELSSPRVAEIIYEETGAKPLLLHSCHNVTRMEFESGITYLELMEGNVENLRKGLDE